jgi:Domain of unknown function (DUF4190)
VTVEQTAQRTSGFAIASLVLGIAGFFVLPLILSILAVVFGNKAREEIRANPGVGGDGLATAGLVLGWIGIAMAALGLLVLLLVLAAV